MELGYELLWRACFAIALSFLFAKLFSLALCSSSSTDDKQVKGGDENETQRFVGSHEGRLRVKGLKNKKKRVKFADQTAMVMGFAGSSNEFVEKGQFEKDCLKGLMGERVLEEGMVENEVGGCEIEGFKEEVREIRGIGVVDHGKREGDDEIEVKERVEIVDHGNEGENEGFRDGDAKEEEEERVCEELARKIDVFDQEKEGKNVGNEGTEEKEDHDNEGGNMGFQDSGAKEEEGERVLEELVRSDDVAVDQSIAGKIVGFAEIGGGDIDYFDQKKERKDVGNEETEEKERNQESEDCQIGVFDQRKEGKSVETEDNERNQEREDHEIGLGAVHNPALDDKNEAFGTMEVGESAIGEVERGEIAEKDDLEGMLSDEEWEGIESSELERDFAKATNFVECGDKESRLGKLGNDVMMQLYGLQKIAMEGPCHEPQPMALKLLARAKWNAWQTLGSMSREEAMKQYITLLTDNVPGLMEVHPAVEDKSVSSEAAVHSSPDSSLSTSLIYQRNSEMESGIGPGDSNSEHRDNK